MIRIHQGDCRERMAELPDSSVDSCVCDPPYELGFMGRSWDKSGIANDKAMWAEVLRVLKPGGHLIAFSGTRTYHRMVCAIEDAGFEIRDQLAWVYGSGFPKSLDVSKQIDKAAGAEREVVGLNQNHRPVSGVDYEGVYAGGNTGAKHITAPATDAAREWQGWGTALKPSWEPICLARKPLIGTVVGNVLAHGTGALNIDGCRVDIADGDRGGWRPNCAGREYGDGEVLGNGLGAISQRNDLGRWPANLCHDGSDEVLAGFPDSISTGGQASLGAFRDGKVFGAGRNEIEKRDPGFGDSGSAARFFYCAKTTSEERGKDNDHPTVKPTALMRWLVRLVTPRGGTVLDPFMGSGSTMIAADQEQFHAIGCELDPAYIEIACNRIRREAGLFADLEVC